MLLLIKHDDENYLKRIMATFKARKAVGKTMIIEGKNFWPDEHIFWFWPSPSPVKKAL